MSGVSVNGDSLTLLMRRQRAEAIVNYYRRGNGIHRLPLEEFTSQDMESSSEEDDDDSIDTQVNQEGEFVRDMQQNERTLEEFYDTRERIRVLAEREEELERELAEQEALRDIYHSQLDINEEVSGARRPHNEVEGILTTLSRVEIRLLEADDLKCLICQSEYGEERGDITNPVSDFDEELPDPQAPESPMILPCGHLFGDLCMYKWLREPQPASCPLCRYKL